MLNFIWTPGPIYPSEEPDHHAGSEDKKPIRMNPFSTKIELLGFHRLLALDTNIMTRCKPCLDVEEHSSSLSSSLTSYQDFPLTLCPFFAWMYKVEEAWVS